MALFLGIDTSNYTTSAAVYDTSQQTIRQEKKLLSVKPGEKGLRQSDALFQHWKNLPDLLDAPFIAFHVSGGTTDCVLCEPDAENGDFLRVKPISGSLDLKAGQAVDRVGVMMGLPFPCGAALEQLALQSEKKFRYRPTMRGLDCCLSGLENQCRKMLDAGEPQEDVARFCLTAVAEVLHEMTDRAVEAYGDLPVLYAGGVMSDLFIRERLEGGQHYFAAPEFSCDNAAGTAVFAALSSRNA